METITRTVHLAVYDTLADWEAGLVIAQLNTGGNQTGPTRYTVATVGESTDPVRTMGGMRVLPDLALDDLSPADSAMLILPGASTWDSGGNTAFARTARAFLDAGVPVAAICGATAGLAREGLFDDREHTSAAPEYLAATGYRGGELYREAAAVRDRGLITAGPTTPVDFARAIITELDTWQPAVLDAWYRLFAFSDASAYGELMALTAGQQ